MKKKLLYLLSVNTLILAFVLMLYFIYQLTYPFEIVRLDKSPFDVAKSVYKPGEQVEYTLNFTKNLNYKPVITYYLVNGFVYPLSRSGATRATGKQTHTLSLKLPDETPEGVYHIQIDLEYEINPLRKINYSWASEDFEVRR